MSNIEERISEIESAYKEIREILSALSHAYNQSWSYVKYMREYVDDKEEFTDEAIKKMMAYQRSLELLVEDAKELRDDKTGFYVNRCFTNLAAVRFRLEDLRYGAYRFLDNNNAPAAFSAFRKLRSAMYAVFQDVRMIYALRVYPIEEKLKLKSSLSDLTFTNVVACLEQAETNLAEKKPSHRKDALCRCREAVEKFVANVLEKEGKKPSNQFSVDIGTVTGLGMLAKEEKRMIEASYSYLSEACHGRIKNLTLDNVNYAIKDTYMRIELFLKRYLEYLARRKQSKK